jgi:transglutaminase-like putative cysteine protease
VPRAIGVPVTIPPTITAPMRQRLNGLADLLIPATDGMPGAAAVDIGGPLLDRVLNVRPDLTDGLLAVLRHPLDDPDGVLEALAADDRAGLRTLRYVVAAAYYLDSDVRSKLGYPGTVASPVRALDFPEFLSEGLLDHLISTPDG